MDEKIRLYVDEHVPTYVVTGLRRRGIDVLTTKESGMLGSPDEEHLALASSQNRVIFTQDDDFLRLHAKGMKHNGIIYSRQQTPVGNLIRRLMLICQVLDLNDMQNHVEFI